LRPQTAPHRRCAETRRQIREATSRRATWRNPWFPDEPPPSGRAWDGCDRGSRRAKPGSARKPRRTGDVQKPGDRFVKLRPEEITSILKQRIEQYDVETDLSEVGTVLQVGDGIARVYGLENCVALERLEFEHGVVGIAFNLEEDNVGVALFGEWHHVKE